MTLGMNMRAPLTLGCLGLSILALWACDKPSTAILKSDEGKALAARLKDPASAEFGSVWTDGGNTCGWVNAKNSFGGYVGSQRFIASPREAMLENDPGVSGMMTFGEMWDLVCQDGRRVLMDGPQPIPGRR